MNGSQQSLSLLKQNLQHSEKPLLRYVFSLKSEFYSKPTQKVFKSAKNFREPVK